MRRTSYRRATNWLRAFIRTEKLILLGGLFVIVVIPGLFAWTQVDSSNNQNGEPNSQTVVLLSPHNTAFTGGVGGGDIQTTDSALVPVSGPGGTAADLIHTPTSDEISLYVVREGDTLGHIAELFDVSVNTIRWANDIPASGTIRPGQVLSILPISSVRHTVTKGETLASITEKYGGNVAETAIFNGLETSAKLAVGDTVLIPGGALGHEEDDHADVPQKTPQTTKPANTTTPPKSSGQGTCSYFNREWGGVVTQGFHGGYRAIDYGMSIGTPIGAAAGGQVIAAKGSGYNGGYGYYVAIKHNNGSQTLYAHLNEVKVSVGQTVQQGDLIGLSGNTGRSTGPHLHFEIRGWGDVPACMR